MSVVSYALTTRQKVKDYLGITNTNSDSLIDTLVNQATDKIESFCGGRRFLQTVYSQEMYDAMGGRSQIGGSIIFLRQFPVTTLSLVEYRSGTVTVPAWVTYDANGYLLYDKPGYVKFFAVLPTISLGLRFTYTAGYLIDFTNETDITKHTLPFDLTDLATQLCALQMNLRKSQGIKLEMTEGQRVEFIDMQGKGFLPEHLEILRKYQTLRMTI